MAASTAVDVASRTSTASSRLASLDILRGAVMIDAETWGYRDGRLPPTGNMPQASRIPRSLAICT